MKNPNIEKIKSAVLDLKNNAKAVLILIAVILLLDAVIILRVQFVSVFRMCREANQVKKKITETKEDAKFYSTYKDRVDVIKAQLQKLDQKGVTEGGLPKAIESISKFANISGVRILKIRPVSRGRGEELSLGSIAVGTDTVEFNRQEFSISASSGFHQFGRFIGMIENSPVFMDVKSVEIRSDDRDPTKEMVTLELEVVVSNKVQ